MVEWDGGSLVFSAHDGLAILSPKSVRELCAWLQPSLDEQIARQVMGWTPSPGGNGWQDTERGERGLQIEYTPSTDEAQAFEAFQYVLPPGTPWGVADSDNTVYINGGEVLASGSTLAEALCLAALTLAP